MQPARTTYHVANSPTAYKKLHSFFREESGHPLAKAEGLPPYESFTISFPSVYGLRDDKIIGVMASQYHPEYGLVASPLHVAYHLKNHVPTILRLVDCYEALLHEAGVSEYLVLLPSWKPSIRLFSNLKHGELLAELPHRLELYSIKVGG
jgi:hypothetical protein